MEFTIEQLVEYIEANPEQFQEEMFAITGGDDLNIEDDKEYFDKYGYETVAHDLEYTFGLVGMIVSAEKRVKVTLNSYPAVEMLQQVRWQYTGERQEKPYLKFMRQAFSFPYKERYSRLYLLLQWVILWGKLDSCLCEQNIDFGASVMFHAGTKLHDVHKSGRIRPAVPNSYWNNRNKIFWNKEYIPANSVYMGAEQFLGLVKQYGSDFLSSVVRYSIGKLDTSVADLVKDYTAELETRAPHRGELATSLFESLSQEDREELGIELKDATSGFISMVPDFLRKWESLTGVAVNSVVLDEPLVGAEVQHQEVGDDDEDDVSIGVDEIMD